jgi:long-chain acyl-CoA synthetase
MEITRIFDLLPQLKEKYQKPDLLNAKVNGKWVSHSTNEVVDTVNSLSLGLMKMGLGKEDAIGNMSPNRPEWNMIDFGMSQLGVKHVPLYPTLSSKDLVFILNDAAVKIAFVYDKEMFDKISSIKDQVESLQEIYSYDKMPGIKHWTEVRDAGKDGDMAALEAIKKEIHPDDLATLIYTSGTTGNPKGVMLTHNNIVSNFTISAKVLPNLGPSYRALSFLPLSHIFERMIGYLYLHRGVSIWYAESMETIGDNLKEVKPQVFTTVPRLLEKVYDKIVGKGLELTGIKKALFFWALKLGLRYEVSGRNGAWYEFQLKLANKIIFNKWREALGGNIVIIVSGGAALQQRLARIFWSAQIPVLEGYGLTETSPVISVTRLEHENMAFSTVGLPISGVEVKIAEDGEILCKGPNVMKGYYKRPDLTAEVIDEDGWFHTGDIGEWLEGKFLKITDRKKEMFKTAGGKYVTPQVLENKYKESPFVEQIMVIGENQRFPAALVVPNFEKVEGWCKKKGINYTTPAEIIKNEQVHDKVWREISALNADFGQWEQVKKFEMLGVEFSIEKGELTPKLSLKRKNILANNKELIEKIYFDEKKAQI